MIDTQEKNNDNTQSILIIDDNQTLLSTLSEALKIHNFKVFEADNGVDGWNIFINERIDIVLTDIVMPFLDGEKLVRRIRKNSSNTTIALMTGGNVKLGSILKNEGIVDYLFEKPFSISSVCKIFSATAPMV